MFVIPRRIPKLYKGYKVILEDGTPEIPTWKRLTGFNIVVDEDDADSAEKRKDDDDDGLFDDNAPMKKMKLA